MHRLCVPIKLYLYWICTLIGQYIVQLMQDHNKAQISLFEVVLSRPSYFGFFQTLRTSTSPLAAIFRYITVSPCNAYYWANSLMYWAYNCVFLLTVRKLLHYSKTPPYFLHYCQFSIFLNVCAIPVAMYMWNSFKFLHAMYSNICTCMHACSMQPRFQCNCDLRVLYACTYTAYIVY